MDKSIKDFIKENYLLIGAILYILSPIDFLPDFLPALGFVDDAFILILTLIYRYYIFKKGDKKLNKTKKQLDSDLNASTP